MRANDIPGIDLLTTEEKIELAEDLWDTIASDPSNVGIPQSHLDELDKRYSNFRNEPGKLLSIDELKRQIERDVETEKLDSLANEALAEYKAGTTREL